MSKVTNANTAQAELPQTEHMSKYGNARLYFLKDHKPELYAELRKDGELKEHCLEVQRIADNRLKKMMEQAVKHNPPPNRNTDGLKWAAHMSMLKHSVEEIIYTELIYE